MNMLKAATAPYMTYILVGVLVVAVAGTALVTGKVKEAGFSKERAALTKKLTNKDSALANAANALRASGAALREINAEAERKLAKEKANKEAFADAANVATAGRRNAERNIITERKAWDRARKKEACRILLDTDIVATCGVKL